MNGRRPGLGRGLGALIPTGAVSGAAPAAAPDRPDAGAAGDRIGAGAVLRELPVTSIRPNPRQPRSVFDEDAQAELAASIAAVGLLQPIVVRPAGPPGYELVMGERRWRAATAAGLTAIPAIVRWTGDDELLRDALLENLHREQLNPLEEAAAYRQLLDDFGATHEQLAVRIGRSRSQVTNTIRLLNLPPAVQRRVAAGVLSAGHARALLSVSDPAAQERLAGRVVAEGMSVRAVEEAVALGGGALGGGALGGGALVDGALGAAAGTGRRRRSAGALDGVAAALSDRYDTRVRVELGRSKGKIVVEFASVADLERILTTLAPGVTVGADPSGAGPAGESAGGPVAAVPAGVAFDG